MKNKVELKKYLLKVLIIFLSIIIIFLILNIYEYHIYTKNFNNKINELITLLETKYPNLQEKEIIEILNSTSPNNLALLKKYGIDLNKNSIIIENSKLHKSFLILNITFLSLSFLILIISFLLYLKKRNKALRDITEYIKEINNHNYSLKIDSNSLDELSILKNEIYKTTVMLKEIASSSKQEKLDLKISLEDISHQLKTPLTSILIMLDNLIADPNMNTETKYDFLKDIKRNVTNIKFLVETLLKLSKFDAHTINFISEKRFINDILKEAIKNVSLLCDLKNIKIILKGNNKASLNCDFKWQVEALTNILKNCVEYSPLNSKIDISYQENNVYSIITIKDYGPKINPEEISHIFERFYKGKNSSQDSIGIGLALAKTIIEKDHGLITVTSNDLATIFTIKYFKI